MDGGKAVDCQEQSLPCARGIPFILNICGAWPLTSQIETQMADSKDARKELRTWYKKVLEDTVREMLKTRAISGAAIDAAPMWAEPYKILIAKVWDATHKSGFIWTIAGEDAVTDHVAGAVAANPQEAARHFALKWQMDAERLRAVAQERGKASHGEEFVDKYAASLVRKAEALYEMTTHDEIWKRQVRQGSQ
jgi:hypothetical protein